jgi:hypothetical protein
VNGPIEPPADRTLGDYTDLSDLPDERLGMLANRARQAAPSSRFTLDADDAHRIFTELIRRRANDRGENTP